MNEYGDIDSKFRYVIVASKRAKQLLKGSKPKIKSKSKNLIRVAQEEVKMGLVGYALVKHQVEHIHGVEDDIFIGEELGGALVAPEDKKSVSTEKKKEVKTATKKKAETSEKKKAGTKEKKTAGTKEKKTKS